MSIECRICQKKLKNINGLSKHIKIHNITGKNYYDLYFKNPGEEYCNECNSPTKFISLGEGYRQYCGYPCPTNNEMGIVWKQSIIKKYGVDNISKLKNIKDKKKATCIKNYNTDNPMKSELVKSNFKKSLEVKYGVDHPSKIDSVRKKTKSTWKKNYGVDHPMQNDKIKNKVKETFINNFLYKVNDFLETKNLKLISSYITGKISLLTFQCVICNTIFKSTYWNVFQGCGRCPKCFPKKEHGSYQQQEVHDFLKSILKNDIIINCKNIIKNPETDRFWELDFYIPSKKIAIEYNGLYWHSFYSPKYHLNKLDECQKLGISLIQIFEDEWLFKNDIVKKRLSQILNVSNTIRIHGRNCVIQEIDSKTKNEFLNNFHLQGKDVSKIKLGAFYNEKLVSVMTFSKGNISKGSISKDNIWELNRFCSDFKYHIPGIASKLLAYFKRNYKWHQIFSYADRRWSIGNLYYKLGFDLKSITVPGYWYIKEYQRIHRFNLRKNKSDPSEISEKDLRINQGYQIIWDCGNLKFNLTNKNF